MRTYCVLGPHPAHPCFRRWQHCLILPHRRVQLAPWVAIFPQLALRVLILYSDIEDTLLGLLITKSGGLGGGRKFSKLDVKRVYFGNWLRDYSQAVDVGTVKSVSAEAIRLILWILGFMSFGFATREFEVTAERLGCYRPEEHIDNPKGAKIACR